MTEPDAFEIGRGQGKPVTANEWIRRHLLYVAGMQPPVTLPEIEAHVERRLGRAIGLIRARVGVGLIRYESNRGRSPCYLEWLRQSVKSYEATGNLDSLLDAAFYAIAEYEDPSRPGGVHYQPEREKRTER